MTLGVHDFMFVGYIPTISHWFQWHCRGTWTLWDSTRSSLLPGGPVTLQRGHQRLRERAAVAFRPGALERRRCLAPAVCETQPGRGRKHRKMVMFSIRNGDFMGIIADLCSLSWVATQLQFHYGLWYLQQWLMGFISDLLVIEWLRMVGNGE